MSTDMTAETQLVLLRFLLSLWIPSQAVSCAVHFAWLKSARVDLRGVAPMRGYFSVCATVDLIALVGLETLCVVPLPELIGGAVWACIFFGAPVASLLAVLVRFRRRGLRYPPVWVTLAATILLGLVFYLLICLLTETCVPVGEVALWSI